VLYRLHVTSGLT